MKFRKKPIVVEAVQWRPDKTFARIDGKGRYFNRRIGYDAMGAEYTICDIGIQTLEGFMSLTPGDWIITGIAGERYPCKPDIFAKTYERVKSTKENS